MRVLFIGMITGPVGVDLVAMGRFSGVVSDRLADVTACLSSFDLPNLSYSSISIVSSLLPSIMPISCLVDLTEFDIRASIPLLLSNAIAFVDV